MVLLSALGDNGDLIAQSILKARQLLTGCAKKSNGKEINQSFNTSILTRSRCLTISVFVLIIFTFWVALGFISCKSILQIDHTITFSYIMVCVTLTHRLRTHWSVAVSFCQFYDGQFPTYMYFLQRLNTSTLLEVSVGQKLNSNNECRSDYHYVRVIARSFLIFAFRLHVYWCQYVAVSFTDAQTKYNFWIKMSGFAFSILH